MITGIGETHWSWVEGLNKTVVASYADATYSDGLNLVHSSSSDPDARCARLRLKTGNLQIDDQNCNQKYSYICEFGSNSPLFSIHIDAL